MESKSPLQNQHQKKIKEQIKELSVLESEIKSLKPGSKVYQKQQNSDLFFLASTDKVFSQCQNSANEAELVENKAIVASDVGEINDLLNELTRAADESLPHPETPSPPTTTDTNSTVNITKKCFKHVSEGQLKRFEEACQSDKTKKNTQWGLNIFQETLKDLQKEYREAETMSAAIT